LVQETPAAIGGRFDHDFAGVHHAVMSTTQRDQIGELGLSAIGPVFAESREFSARRSAGGMLRVTSRPLQKSCNYIQ
jgi:hypothetical protein